MLIHRYETPTRFVAGTVGAPGERTFFLQAREQNRLTSVSVEKEQVAVLAERIDSLLTEAAEADQDEEGDEQTPAFADAVAVGDSPVADSVPVADSAPLDQPIEEEFRVGVLTLSWDGSSRAVVIEAFAATEDDSEEASDVLVVQLTAAAARGFAERARQVVAAGRAQCQFCGGPIDPQGHLCPRANGYRRIARD